MTREGLPSPREAKFASPPKIPRESINHIIYGETNLEPSGNWRMSHLVSKVYDAYNCAHKNTYYQSLRQKINRDILYRNETFFTDKFKISGNKFTTQQGSDRIDSFWFANFWFAEVNQKSQKDFDSRFNLILFTLLRSDFDSSRIMIHSWILVHLLIKIKSNQKLKVGGSWFNHLRVIGLFDFESKPNQSESRIKLVQALLLRAQHKILHSPAWTG